MTATRLPVPDGSDFTIDNLPYGVVDRGDGPRPVIAVGEHVIDLRMLGESGLLPGDAAAAFEEPGLEAFMAGGRALWQETRHRLREILTGDDFDDVPGAAVLRSGEAPHLVPFRPGDFIDFYASIEHASNLGRMFRPDSEPLLPNWRHVPVGYHGRASSVVVSGTPITRPAGQVKPAEGPPTVQPTGALDFELEMGFVVGVGNDLGTSIDVDDAGDHIFGMVLVNDWSARDIQRWEYQPLGPFLGKSFATTVSPWIVTLEALAPFMTAPPPQDPAPLDYLDATGDWAIDVNLEVSLLSAEMRERDMEPLLVTRTGFAGMYWTIAQQLAHATVNGTNARTGDLYASGTVSGPDSGTFGSLIEATWNGRDPIDLPDGSQRRFLEDGDTVIMRAWCETEGVDRVGFGECVGTVVPVPRTP